MGYKYFFPVILNIKNLRSVVVKIVTFIFMAFVLFKKLYFINNAITVVLTFHSLPPSAWYPYSLQRPLPPPPLVHHVHGSWCACKFFGFSISYTVLNIPLYFVPTNLYFLTPVPFLLFSPFFFPVDNPPNDLHICDSVALPSVALVQNSRWGGSALVLCLFLVL